MRCPGLGILLIILVIPGAGADDLGTRRRQAQGRSMSWVEKMLAFLGSLGVVAVIGLAGYHRFRSHVLPHGDRRPPMQ